MVEREELESNAVLGTPKYSPPPMAKPCVKPAFARLRFGEWSRILVGKINRNHYYFVLDWSNQVVGFVGWAVTSREKAEDWVVGRGTFSDAEGTRAESARGALTTRGTSGGQPPVSTIRCRLGLIDGSAFTLVFLLLRQERIQFACAVCRLKRLNFAFCSLDRDA